MNDKTKALLIAAGVLLVFGAISSNSDDTDTTAKPAVKASATPEAKPSKAAKATSEAPTVSKFDRPTSAEAKTLLAKLEAINPGITVKEDRAVRRSVSTCQRIQAGDPEKSVIEYTSLQFTGGNATVDERQAADVAKAIKASFCD
ncbi:hypothetical protein [Streptomyces cadmiisoli]|uniref:hypothetical protein n=1 Tax=Streptomyces cadmiisoli TaxID=2184053 RepID=UPI00364EF88F